MTVREALHTLIDELDENRDADFLRELLDYARWMAEESGLRGISEPLGAEA